MVLPKAFPYILSPTPSLTASHSECSRVSCPDCSLSPPLSDYTIHLIVLMPFDASVCLERPLFFSVCSEITFLLQDPDKMVSPLEDCSATFGEIGPLEGACSCLSYHSDLLQPAVGCVIVELHC